MKKTFPRGETKKTERNNQYEVKVSPLFNDYEKWIANMVQEDERYIRIFPSYSRIMNFKYNGHGYWDFMDSFKRMDKNYNKPIIYDLAPIVIKDISGSCSKGN